VHFDADAFAHFVVETKGGLVKVVVGVRGPDAEKYVEKLVDCAHEINRVTKARQH